MKITVRGDVDPRAIEQLQRCANTGDAVAAAICADGHVGYSHPIGGVIAYRDHISPSGVGYDIGCGNKAVRTNLYANDLLFVDKIMDEIVARISFGMGRNNNEPIDHPVLDTIAHAPFTPQRKLAQLAANQLGNSAFYGLATVLVGAAASAAGIMVGAAIRHARARRVAR